MNVNKKTVKKSILVLPLILLISTSSTLAASPGNMKTAWSSPTYTEQWSTPTYTEQWSNDLWTEPEPDTDFWGIPSLDYPESKAPATPAPTPAPAENKVNITLQIDNPKALVQGKEQILAVPPRIMNGRTMVPLRFISESLQASVDWSGAEKKITVTLQANTIILHVNQSTATVNGRQVDLDAPPVIIDGSTLVPLRFIGENLNLDVNYTAATKTIEIKQKDSSSSLALVSESPRAIEPPLTNESPPTNNQLNREPITEFEKLYGTWSIWTPGGATNLYYRDTGNYATHIYDQGADQGFVTINADGTYAMKHAVWGEAEGKWRLSFPAEINGERIQGIILLDGPSGSDWAVAPAANGKVRLLSSSGAWADGSTMWIFDSDLNK